MNKFENNVINVMYIHDMEVDKRTWIDISENISLSVIPEYGYRYRDEEDKVYISRNPTSVMLNTMVFKQYSDGWDIEEDTQEIFNTDEEFISYLTRLRKEFA